MSRAIPRPGKDLTLASGLVTLSLLLGGCASAEHSSPRTAAGSGKAGSASRAPITSTPTPTGPHRLSALPITPYTLTAEQAELLTRAESVLVHSCMKGFGLDYTLPTSPETADNDDPSGDLPNNDPRTAAVQGYRNRGQAAAEAARQRRATASAPVDPQVVAALVGASTPGRDASGAPGPLVDGRPLPAGGCLGQARRTIAGHTDTDPDALFGDTQLVTDTRMNSYFQALSDSLVKHVFAAWSLCMKAKGFNYASPVAAVDDPRWNAQRPPTALELTTATADVTCKYQHNVDGVFHAVQVAYETAAIKAHLGALQTLSADRDAALRRATQIDATPSPTP